MAAVSAAFTLCQVCVVRRAATAVALSVALAGCGSAHLLAGGAGGGVVALEGARAPARRDAHRLMTARCGGAYTVVAERDERVGDRGVRRAHFRCGVTPGQPHSQYAPPDTSPGPFPEAERVFLD